MPLDRRRDYGFVAGATDGKVFEQDGRWFTATGEDWVPVGGEPYTEPSPELAAQVYRASEQASELTRSVMNLPKRR